MLTKRLAYGATTSLLALAAATAVYAQETTGGIRGQITDENGAPVANATVTITHEPTGSNSTAVTSPDGTYAVRNLRVGGPYRVRVSAANFEDETASVPTIGIGAPAAADITLFASNSATVEELVVTATANAGALATGPQLRITSEDVETLPSISRDVKDFVRLSPFAHVDPTNNDALVLGGQHNRFNAILIDGVRQGDDFGLQANGYPTQRSPISISAIEAVSVQVAPFDVQYGEFLGGVLNLVTKSGGNEFHGEAFYEGTNQDLRGDSFSYIDQQTRQRTNRTGVASTFKETTYGATLTGPIIKDRLFFALNYEYFEGTEPVTTGPQDSSAPNRITGITQADVDRVRQILQSTYQYDPLGWQQDELLTTDEKYFAKLDWNINDDHRAVVSYQQTEGSVLNSTGTSFAQGDLGLLSKWYTLGTELKVYKGQLFSNWTDNFSTELSISRKEVANISSPLAGTEFAEFEVKLNATNSIFLGPDISRQANVLTNDATQYRIKGDYRIGNHTITGGYERSEVDVFNLFVQRASGQYVFNSIADLQARNAASLQYSSAASNNREGGAASFSYAFNTLYLQDEWEITPDLTLTAGLRYDFYQSDDEPQANARFQTAYGLPNNANLDGISMLQPRIGFNWQPDPSLTVYGGVGMFAGGTPTVWVSNSYSNPGNLTGFVSCNTANQATVCPGALSNVNGFQVAPSVLAANTASANAGTGNISALDPDFEMPSVWRATIGAEKIFDAGRFGEDWRIRGELLVSETHYALDWIDLFQENNVVRAAPDGRPVYAPTRANRTDVLLSNTGQGDVVQFAVGIGKEWREGLLEGLSFDLSHTWQNARDVNPGTSSVATSNLGQVATATPGDIQLATSNYQTEYSTKLSLGYSREFFGDNRTSIRLFGSRRAGTPFSYTFDYTGSSAAAADPVFGENGVYAQRDRQLLYVPRAENGVVTATSDPIVRFAPGFDLAGFNTFLNQTGLISEAGRISKRNRYKSEDVMLFDMRIAQELPAFWPNGAKLEAYLDVENLGNLLNDEWGVLQQVGFPYFSAPVTARNCQTAAGACAAGVGNFYEYATFTNRPASTFATQSVWQVKLGVRFKF
jgi:hypothetical protein